MACRAINGCPDDGPAMAVDADGTVHMVWPTLLNGTDGTLLYATAPAGKAFGKPLRVPTLGSPKPPHPQIAIDGAGRAVIAWDEVRDGVRRAADVKCTHAENAQRVVGTEEG